MSADTTQGTGLGAAQTTRGANGGKGAFYANVDVLTKLNDLPQVICKRRLYTDAIWFG